MNLNKQINKLKLKIVVQCKKEKNDLAEKLSSLQKKYDDISKNYDQEKNSNLKQINLLTKENDYVLITNPFFYSFRESIEDNNRKVISRDLVLKDGHYEIDFEDFEKKIVDNKIKLFFLCNPQNPTGRVFTREELEKLGDICVKYGVIVVSDEIHNDFAFFGEHTVFTKVKKEFEDISIVCTSVSKTFNLASMLISLDRKSVV